MTVKVTLEFDTASEAADFLATLEDGQPAAIDAEPKKSRGRPRKEKEPAAPTPAAASPAAPATQPAAAVSAAPAAATPAPTPSSASAVQYKDLVEPLTQLAEKDYDAAKAILGKYGAAKADQLKAENYAAVLAELNAALGNGAPAAKPMSLV